MKPEVSTAPRRRRLSPPVRPLAALATSLAIFGGLVAVARPAHAEQFVVMDATFTYTWDMALNARPSRSHFYVNEGNFLAKNRPPNWLSPIDYRNGTVHIRTEVIEKPAGTQQAGWALCYIANSGGYGCPYTNYYTSKGVYDRDVSMKSFYNNAQINWQSGIKQIDLVYTINGSGSGHIHNFPNLKDAVTPTKVRITMIQVSAGSTYDPKAAGFDGVVPVESPPEMARDGGAAVDAGLADAGGTPGGSGGRTGENGSGGAGGSASGQGGSGPTPANGGSTGSDPSGSGGTTGPGPAAGTGGSSGTVTGTGGSGRPNTNAGSRGSVSGGCSVAPHSGRSAGTFTALALAALAFATSARNARRRRATTPRS